MAVISEIKKKSRNLIDEDTLTIGYIGTTGNLMEGHSQGEKITDFIEIDNTKTYSIKQYTDYSTPYIMTSLYDENKNFIAETRKTTQKTFLLWKNLPSNAKYIRISARALEYDNNFISLLEGEYTIDTMPSYEPYYLDVTKYNNETIKNIKFNGVNYHFAKPNEVANGTCENAVNEPIVNMQIQGNSIQDGTPTPEAPIEIRSVGEKTINLADISNGFVTQYTGIANEVIGNTLKTTCSVAARGGNLIIGTFPAGVYTISVKKFSSFIDGVETPKSLTTLVNGTNINLKIYGNEKNKITLTETSSITFYHVFNNSNDYYILEDLMLYAGEEEKDFEPYGYKIPVKASGKNLFDIAKAENGTLATANGGDLSVVDYPNRCRSGFIYLTAGSYVVSFKELISTGNYLHRYSSNNQSSWLGSLNLTKSDSVSKFTLDTDCYIRFTIQPIDTSSSLVLNTDTLKQYQPQLEKGTTATDFEPYIEPTTTDIYIKEPLRMINDVADVLDYKNKKVIRNIKQAILTGEEKWRLWIGNSYPNIFVNFDFVDALYNSNIKCMCDTLTAIYNKNGGSNNDHNVVYFGGTETNKTFYINVDGMEASVDNLKTWLAQHKPTIAYVLATPTEETIEVPEIMTFDGTTTFDVDTVLEPSGLSVKYWKQI